ncbi:MAG TPA: transglutaminase family protein [Candidatus Competibacteraceae bacterium]|nr:transglutaminase family protein [Candidatus Competibacteraceae bacterium]MCP5134582.1 transglutaminase family protein [Gammaproteobacteria bacterium]HPF58461.1 transglutaminase family protein [Candidatus Competibacteraceae bacterium]HRY17534.1 transglutaminase family protein [Candidatus Competibacteraceae bacterium]
MQRLQIRHLTVYEFSNSVMLQPHRLLIRPREGHDVRIESSKLEISPAHRVKWHRDVFDNSVAVVRFLETAQRLAIDSKIVIQHYEEAPLDFIVEDYAVDYPFEYCEEERVDLAPFQQLIYAEQQSVLHDWLRGLNLLSGKIETYVLLDRLNRIITNEFNYMVREEPGVQSPAQTLRSRSGSCRDYATLFIEACRFLGLASRFVSGYSHVPGLDAGGAATHAWAEVYLPGPGWKGFDPTAGELTGSRHIPVAVARHPEMAPPVAGSFVGPKDTFSTLHVEVQVTASVYSL